MPHRHEPDASAERKEATPSGQREALRKRLLQLIINNEARRRDGRKAPGK